MTKLVDSYIESMMILQKIPGLALAVLQNGRPQILKGYGYANLEHKVPVSTNTLFQTGSLGSQFTATIALMLVEQKILDIDAKVGEYLSVPGEWSTITVRQLLSHTSGLRDYALKSITAKIMTRMNCCSSYSKCPWNSHREKIGATAARATHYSG